MTSPNTKIRFGSIDTPADEWRWWDLYPSLGSASPPNQEHIEILKKGAKRWNDWRKAHPSVKPQLSGINFAPQVVGDRIHGMSLKGFNLAEAELKGVQLHYATLQGLRLDSANLRESLIMQANVKNCSFSGANLTQVCFLGTSIAGCKFDRSDMLHSHLMMVNIVDTTFVETSMEYVNLFAASVQRTKLASANLSETYCNGSTFTGCDLSGSNLQSASFVKSKLLSCNITGALVYGVNAWDVAISDDTTQLDLVVTEERERDRVKVDDLRVAQLIHLILTNSNIRQVIETVGNKAVLVLGRFSEERKLVLEGLRRELRRQGLVPIIFDFQGPAHRDFTEVVSTLAGLCLFVIADITSPKSVPLELHATVPNLMLPFVPILQEGEAPLSMFRDLQNKYDWVLPTLEYGTAESLIEVLDQAVIQPALKVREHLQQRKTGDPGMRHVKDFSASRRPA